MAKFCPNCGSSVKAKDRYCNECGGALESTSASKSRAKSPTTPILKTRLRPATVWVAGSVVAVALIATAVLLFLPSRDAGDDLGGTAEQITTGLENGQKATTSPKPTSSQDAGEKQPTAPPVHACDRLAADPWDAQKVADGVEWEALNAHEAIQACREATAAHPQTLRFVFQVGRALAKNGEHQEAAKWFSKAADQSHAGGQVGLAVLYGDGNGVEQSWAEAAKWVRKAADQDHPEGQTLLAVLYAQGNGVEKNISESANWLRKAADQNYPHAMLELANYYQAGMGVERNEKAAAELALGAVKTGDDRVVKLLTRNPSTWRPSFLRQLQELMKQEGVYDGPIDGRLGPRMKRALEALAKSGRASPSSSASAPTASPQTSAEPELNLDNLGDLGTLD